MYSLRMDVWLTEIPDEMAREFNEASPSKRARLLAIILETHGHHVSFSEPVLVKDNEVDRQSPPTTGDASSDISGT